MGLEFSDRAVLVTGGSRGIGRAICVAFAERGARVAVHCHSQVEAAEAVAGSLPGGPHVVLPADLAVPASAAELVAEAARRLGRLDVVVNNAGVYDEHPPLGTDWTRWSEVWRRTLATNLEGPAHVSYWAALHMAANGGGRIVNISSRGAFRGEPDAPAYGASKAGLNAMSQSLAKALAPRNVFVYVVAPGWVETEMAAATLAGPEGDAIRAQSPLGRVARPEEVAHTVVFLAAPGAEFLTGAIVDVNGASYLRS
jgi:NAD(P)-dependent dehydrogenase (short-subunit alcohol dehydrogenase family)